MVSLLLFLRKGYLMNIRYRNKILIFLLILAIAIPHGLIKGTNHVQASQTGTVTAGTLNVRSGPSVTSEKIVLNGTNVYLVKDETVEILETSGDFYYVSLKFNGRTIKGYVHKDYVSVSPTPTPTVTPKPSATPKPTATPVPTQSPTPTPKPASVSDTTVKKEMEMKATVTASTLNVRNGPGTSYQKVAGLVKGDSLTVISEITTDNVKWFGISFKQNGKTLTGYASALYIKLSYSKSVKAEVAVSKLKIRTTAGDKSAYIKNKSGSIIYLKEAKSVSVVGETTVSGAKWYKITFSVDKKEYTGFVTANQIRFKVTIIAPTVAPTLAPTATPKPTAKPTEAPQPSTKPTQAPQPTTKPTQAPLPTVKPTQAPQPSVSPTAAPKPTIAPTPVPTTPPAPTAAPVLTPSPEIFGNGLLQIQDVEVSRNINTPRRGQVCNTFYLNAFGDVTQSISYLFDENYNAIVLQGGQEVIVTYAHPVDSTIFYKADFWHNGVIKTGYVQAEYIYLLPENSTGTTPGDNNPQPPTPTPEQPDPGVPGTGGEYDFEVKLALEGFPESYKPALRLLHEQFPTWEFKAYHTGLDWNTVIFNESVPGRNLIPNSKSVEWKSLEKGAYDWKTDTFIVFDGSTWITASKAAIEYYMDPRNFLTREGIFQFELLRYQKDYQNLTGVENILRGTALSKAYYEYKNNNGVVQKISYGETFIEAAKYSGVSPYHLASRVKQEVVTGASTLSNSVSGVYPGYEGLYNFFNVGANDSPGGGAIANGLRYAKNGDKKTAADPLYLIPWTDPYRSILGGSYFIGGGYINRGQDTIYLQKFNVTAISTYFHQYMTNVEAPWAEAKKVLSAYSGMTDAPIVFSIPVYLNMTEKQVPAPTTMFNPNNRMKSLKVLDISGNELAITPTFSQTEMNYYLTVANNIDIVEIKAVAVSKKAKILGGGHVALNVGMNEVKVPVVAENGDIAEYKIIIQRE